jgi:hypothetical protein
MRSVWLLAWLGLTCALPAGAAESAGLPFPAVWREQHLNFVYPGRTSRFSCDGLRDKVRSMLLDLGARRDLRISAIDCGDSPTLSLDIVVSMPALTEAAAKSQHSGDLAPVDARFETFSIAVDPFRNMGMADCELVQEFSRQILPKLATRAVTQDIDCAPTAPSGSRFLVRGEILRALP